MNAVGFLSPTHKERLKHWANGIKDTKALNLLNGVGIYEVFSISYEKTFSEAKHEMSSVFKIGRSAGRPIPPPIEHESLEDHHTE